MIVEFLKSKRDPTKAQDNVFYPIKAGLTQQEYLKRDRLIRKLADEAGYVFGSIVRPTTKEAFDKEGYYRVTAICTGWYSYKGSTKNDSDVEWPANENPKIVQIMSLKDGKVYECTTNYVVAVTDPKEKEIAETLGC